MTVLSNIRKKKVFRFVAAFLAVNMLAQIASPTVAWALTSPSSQPEVQSFEPAGTSDMVDLFSGDFNYNIPLFDLPGPDGSYPFNLAYHSGIGMDQEASWVGLGWNINPGAINRDKRGLPDDFSGESIHTELDMATNATIGGSLSNNYEVWGADIPLNVGLTIYNNSYKGMGYSFDAGINFSSEHAALGLGLSLDSQEGVGANLDVSYSNTTKNKRTWCAGIGGSFNSKRGLDIGLFENAGEGKADLWTRKNGKPRQGSITFAGSSSYSFADNAFLPAFTSAMQGKNLQISIKGGMDAGGTFINAAYSGFFREENIKDLVKDYAGYGYNYLESANASSLMDFNREKDGIIRKETPNLPSPVLTYDSYMALGQGFLGSYRAHRSDVGHLHDPYVESEIHGGSIGAELGFGAPFHLGLAGALNSTTMNSGDWTEDNDLLSGSDLNYSYVDGSYINDHDYEKLYYKIKGEPTSFNTDEMDYIGGESAVRAKLKKHGSGMSRFFSPEDSRLVTSAEKELAVSLSRRDDDRGRIARDNSVQPITNELLMGSSTELLNEYNIDYYGTGDLTDGVITGATPTSYSSNRSAHPKQNAGFTCVNPSGLRYVYALPAYNKTEEEIANTINPANYTAGNTLTENTNLISSIINLDSNPNDYKVTNSDKFKSKTSTPAYAHAYLLTSVLGADYVDADGTPGPSDGDYGYWVKFNYIKTNDDYKWRSPYNGAMYIRGTNTMASDDKSMFSYGTKEVWNLASAETKSHIAIFKFSARLDGRGANSRYTGGVGSDVLYKLDEINLYSKAEYGIASPLVPLKTVHFDYTYDLCGHVPNNSGASAGSEYYDGIDRNANKGKLTLKKVWFTYQNNTRGELSPYEFDYNERDGSNVIDTGENPNYGNNNYDRWGNYRDTTDIYKGKNLSYVTQFDPATAQTQAHKNTFKTQTDKNAAVWNLKQINLPTGGSITMDYEADDYAYVQHRQATQMFQILRMGSKDDDGDPTDHGDLGKVYGSDWNTTSTFTHHPLRRVYFKLETPIPASTSAPDRRKEIFDNYLAGLRQSDGNLQMYFRIKSNLRNSIYETVSGYCNLQEESTDYDVNTNVTESIDGVSSYTEGYITLKLTEGANAAISDKGPIEYHPFAVAAWQYMRINQPDLLTTVPKLNYVPGSSAMDKAMKVKSLLSVFPAIAQVFSGYRRHAFNHNWASHIELAKSFIRLATPDKIKFGGGLRVKKITYNDNWNNSSESESSNSYGQVYNYTTTEGTGASAITCSSGVAAYEPLIGGDEIALRHARTYMQTLPVSTDNNLFYEYPINESYYPGASVGYSKVTVQSIASSRTMATTGDLNEHIPTTGIVEYEFYTAKDFPVITDETPNQVQKTNLFVPIPFLGQINANKLYGSQGYSITLNDMQGKLKSIVNYEKNVNGEKNPAVISSVRYEYKSTTRQYDGQTVNVLDNEVDAIVNDTLDKTLASGTYNMTVCNKKKVILGEEYDFFTDARQSKVDSKQWGVSLNMEIGGIFVIPCPWPNMSTNTKNLKTMVTNKVISKSGILIATIATDGQSTVKTENKLFDSETGAALLTTVTNDFNNPVYNYNHPAHWEYDNMGAAAKNFNYSFYAYADGSPVDNTFKIDITDITKNKHGSVTPAEFAINNLDFYNTIAEGDELIMQEVGSSDKYIATLITKNMTYDGSCNPVYTIRFHSSGASTITNGNEVKFIIVRSGRRNMLSTDVGSITALKDPTDNANRGLYTASSSSPNISYELADFLNSLLEYDCTPSNGKELQPMTISFDNSEFYDDQGNALYPLLSSIFTSIKIEIGDEECLSGDKGYNLKFTYINEDGDCQTSSCDCIAPIKTGATIANYSFEGNPEGTVKANYAITYEGGGIFASNYFSCFSFNGPPKYTYIDDVISSSSVLFRNFWDYDGEAAKTCGTASPDQTNLYALGKKGIWKPYRNYYYKDERVNQVLATDVKLKHDGVYKGTGTYSPKNEFYLYKWNPTVERPLYASWLPNSLVSMYDQNSNAVQTKDIVNLYSSVVYGYNNQLPIIQGNNARRNELFSESFDDTYSSRYASGSATIAHTGKRSITVLGNDTYLTMPELSLTIGNSYTFSLWVSRNAQPATYSDPGGDDIGVYMVFYDAFHSLLSTSTVIKPTGNVIEKWQRIEGNFTVPSSTVTVEIKFQTNANGGGDVPTYFDDIRVFPTKSNVSTSVYDPNNFRISAVLDANNFATFYHYDGEGKLFVVKKETTAGIKTIKEERGHVKE